MKTHLVWCVDGKEIKPDRWFTEPMYPDEEHKIRILNDEIFSVDILVTTRNKETRQVEVNTFNLPVRYFHPGYRFKRVVVIPD